MRAARTFLIGVLIGAVLTLAGLGTLRLAHVPRIAPIIETDAAGLPAERFLVGPDDLLTVSSQTGVAYPPAVKRLQGDRLADVEVATMKVRNARNEVIGVASRIAGADVEPGLRSVWWTFVLGRRGTLAAWLPDGDRPGDGTLAGGTADFEDASGQFAERTPAPGAYELTVRRGTAP
jgi:hypothetical protein